MPEVKLVNVSKRYGRIKANDGINLTIKDKEYVSVIGPSGCGKTTLIRNIAGIIHPDEGEIFIDEESVSNVPIEDRRIGYVFQNIALFPHMNIWDNITYGPHVRGLPQQQTRPLALEMLDMIKIAARSEAYPHELSGGTQQKTAVARALISDARLLLLDEPLGALDVKVRTELRYELRRLVKDLRLTALHVTHDQEEAMSISDRVVVMKKGRIVEAGTPVSLYTRPQHTFTANFVGEANFLKGIVVETTADTSVVDIGSGVQLRANRGKETVDERVIVVFRPEFAVLDKPIEVNRLSGKVMDVLYSGSIIRVMIKLPNDETIAAKRIASFDKPMYDVSESVTISVSPDNVLVYPYPEEGLKKALALE
ncbi:MAG: ABC transporter ATP-binding protein [Candidatus Bathyarchaeota archaeon]|nr:MAG: ABC transporter ATP-binding protein [Candidatus Bathyarchaeota archaeon]